MQEAGKRPKRNKNHQKERGECGEKEGRRGILTNAAGLLVNKSWWSGDLRKGGGKRLPAEVLICRKTRNELTEGRADIGK